jgi:PAS domain S-box-containing protein
VSLHPLFDHVPDALLIVGRDGRIERANVSAHKLFDYDSGDLASRPIEDLIPEAARERHRHHRESYMQQPRIRPMGAGSMSLVGQRRDGTQFPVEIALSPFESDSGPQFLASVRDISETLRARQALTRARYDAVLGRIGHLALSTDGDAMVDELPGLLVDAFDASAVVLLEYVNGACHLRAYAGLSANETASVAGGLSAMGAIQESESGDHAGTSAQLQSVIALHLPALAVSTAAVPLVDRGHALGALLALSNQPGHFDQDAGLLLQNVANLLAALLQRRRTEEQLAHAQRLEAIGQLTGGIAHDFNNLLTVVSGSLQLLESECGDQAEALDIIGSALRSVERGSALTAKLLAFARRQHLTPKVVAPVALLGDLGRMLRSTLGDAVRVNIECPSDLPAIYVDASQLDSALVNLAINARDAMPQGGEVTISARQCRIEADPARPQQSAGDYVAFRVADNGRGMPPEVLARAFEPFFTTKAPGRGSGLGLSMVYGFVQQSGGHLHIDSRTNLGTEVELFLPVATAPAAEAPERPAAEQRIASERILVVEDEPDVRNIACAFLRSFGYGVVAVGTAVEALEHLATDPRIAVLFTDVMLGGGMNGVELAQATRSLRPDIGVLLTSGYDEQATAAESARDFELLRKPYRREQLAEAVKRNLPGAD